MHTMHNEASQMYNTQLDGDTCMKTTMADPGIFIGGGGWVGPGPTDRKKALTTFSYKYLSVLI